MILIIGGALVVILFIAMRFLKKNREKTVPVVQTRFTPPSQPIQNSPADLSIQTQEQPKSMGEYARDIIAKMKAPSSPRRPEDIWGRRY